MTSFIKIAALTLAIATGAATAHANVGPDQMKSVHERLTETGS